MPIFAPNTLAQLPPEMIQLLDNIFKSHPSIGRGLDSSIMSSAARPKPMLPTNPTPNNSMFMNTKAASYTMGFCKKAFKAGLNKEQVVSFMKEAGFTKEAFLPLLIDLASMIGGGMGADALAVQAGKHLPGLAEKFLPGMVERKAAKAAIQSKLQQSVAGSQDIENLNKLNSNIPDKAVNFLATMREKHPWMPGNLGGFLAPMITEPITSALTQPAQDPSQYSYQDQGMGQ